MAQSPFRYGGHNKSRGRKESERGNGNESAQGRVSRLGIPCAGTKVYAARYREEWLKKIPQAGVCRRAELLNQQLDELQALRRKVRAVLSREPKT